MPTVSPATSPWFIDSDDGTLIEFRSSFLSGSMKLAFRQNTTLGGCNALTSLEPVSLVEPAPLDFTAFSGSVSRFNDRLSLFMEEYTPSRIDSVVNVAQAEISEFAPVRTFVTRHDFVNVESLGLSSGSPNQVFFVSGSVILLPTKGTPTVFVGGTNGERWAVTPDLTTALPDARVFEYDQNLGQVTFGDGIHGAIPVAEQGLSLRISIRNGGGTWKYVGLVVEQKAQTNIGLVKTVRNKIFYSQAKIAYADASKVTNVHSKLNCIVQDVKFEDGTLLKQFRLWSLSLGGEVTASGGNIALTNTTGNGFIKAQTRRATQPPGPTSVDHKGAVVPNGSNRDVNTHIPLTMVQNYPSMKATAPAGGNFQAADANVAGLQIVEMTPLIGGVITTPKPYKSDIQVYPIFEIREEITYNQLVVHAPQLDGQPCSATPTPTPIYRMWWFTWPDVYFIPISGFDVENFSSPNQFRVADTEMSFFARLRCCVNPLQNTGRNIRMTQIADVVGDFDNDVRQGADANGYNTVSSTVYGDSIFGRAVSGSSARHPEWAAMTWEARVSDFDKEYELRTFGGILSQDFVCTWDAEEGIITQLPDLIITKTLIGSPCVNVVINDVVGDYRLKGVSSTYQVTSGIYPFLPG